MFRCTLQRASISLALNSALKLAPNQVNPLDHTPQVLFMIRYHELEFAFF